MRRDVICELGAAQTRILQERMAILAETDAEGRPVDASIRLAGLRDIFRPTPTGESAPISGIRSTTQCHCILGLLPVPSRWWPRVDQEICAISGDISRKLIPAVRRASGGQAGEAPIRALFSRKVDFTRVKLLDRGRRQP